MLIDTHCHLDFENFDKDRDAVIRRAFENKIDFLVNVGASIDSSRKSLALATQYQEIFFSLGFHPHYADSFNEATMQTIADIKAHPKLVAIGEIGLDYYRNLSGKEQQEKVFRTFIGLGKTLNLPLIVHCRESFEDTKRILKQERGNFSGVVFHCFSGSLGVLEECLKEGALVSFTATVTYPQAQDLKEVVHKTPLERMMLETDAPFLPPQQFRGKRNEPAYVQHVAATIAELKQISVDEVARATTDNAKKFFRLPLSIKPQQA